MCWGFATMIPDIAKMVGQRAINPSNPMDPTSLRVQTVGQQIQFLAVMGFFIVSLRFMVISKRWMIHGECEEKRWRSLGWVTVTIAGLMAVGLRNIAMRKHPLISLQFRTLFVQVSFDARFDPKSFYATHEWMYWLTQEIPVFSKFLGVFHQ